MSARLARRGSKVGGHAGLAAVAALAMTLAITSAACSAGPTPTPGPIETASIVAPASGTPGPADQVPASPVTGVLVRIDSSGLAAVAGFDLRLDDGRVLSFRIGTLENGDVFPPGHLAEHLATSAPVRVYFRVSGTDLVVYRLEDGG